MSRKINDLKGLLAKTFAESSLSEESTNNLPNRQGTRQPSTLTTELPSSTATQQPSNQATLQPSDTVPVLPSNHTTEPQGSTVARLPKHPVTLVHSSPATVSPSSPVALLHSSTTTQQPDSLATLVQGAITTGLPNTKVVGAPSNRPIPYEVLTLTCNQAKVLKYLINHPEKKVTINKITKDTGVAFYTSRDIIKRLQSKGFIGNVQVIKNSDFQGVSYILNEDMCSYFMQAGDESLTVYAVPFTVAHAEPPSSPTVDGHGTHSSSLLESKKLTTTTCPTVDGSATQQEVFVLQGSEVVYWLGVGLGEGQTQSWLKEFGLTAPELRQQLAWASYDLQVNGKEEGIGKVISWFYTVLKNTAGNYPKPVGYKSPEELRLEDMKRELERAKAVREEANKIEMELEFERLLSKPDSAEYQELMQKAGCTLDSPAFIRNKALRAVFFDKYSM